MKGKSLAIGFAVVFLVFAASSPVVYGQSEPDLEATSIGFDDDDVHVGTTVQITGTITNIGLCYIVLGDNNDEVGYNYSFSASQVLRVRPRVRSSNGDLISVQVRVDTGTPIGFTTSSTTWETQSALNVTAPGIGGSTLYLKVISGGDGDTDLHIDWIEVDEWDVSDWSFLFKVEAEDYDSGGSSVNAIHPSPVQVEFYDGDPDDSGSQIGGTQEAYDASNDTEAGTTNYLSEGGSDALIQNWTAEPWGYHDIYVKVLDYPNEGSTANNKTHDTVSVYANLTTETTTGGTTNPAPGVYPFYEDTTVTVEALREEWYCFDRWELDDVEVGDDDPDYPEPYPVEMDGSDHTLKAFFVGPTVVTLADFTAVDRDGSITLEWETRSEINNTGYNVYRSAGIEKARTRLNGELIPAKGDELHGASYSFSDKDITDGVTYCYWLEDVGLDGKGTTHGPVLASKKDPEIPAVFSLGQNYPNPFNPTTEIRFDLPSDCFVTLEVYNVVGQRVATIVNEHMTAGAKIAHWNAKDNNDVQVTSGVYFYKLQAGDFVEIKKMVLLR